MSATWVRILFWLYLLFLVWADATFSNPADPDLWHRLALGESLWQTGHFPSADASSYLADFKQVADHEWGSALVFYFFYPWAYPGAFVGIKLITLAVTLWLIVLSGLRDRRPTMLLAAFYAVVLLAMLPSFMSTVRCMTFTHVFFALWLYWFQCERHGRPIATAWYVLTMLIWANLHGGFVIGLVWLFTVGALSLAISLNLLGGTRSAFGSTKTWALRLGLCSLVTLVNPFGIQLWYSTIGALLTTREGFNEWAPVSWWPDVLVYAGYKFLLFGLIIALIVLIRYRGWKKINRPIVLLIGLFAFLAMTSARHTSLFAAVAGALAPGLFPSEPYAENIANPIYRLSYIGACLAFLLVPLFAALRLLPGDGFKLRLDSASCPVEAVDYLKDSHIKGNLLVPFNYGSYALWHLRGDMRVSMDGRYDLVYRPETYRRVEDFFHARGDWPKLLTTPKTDAILVPVSDAIYPELQHQPGWTEAWHNPTDAVFLPAR